MYFVVLGKTPKLSLEELQLVYPQHVVRKGGYVFFDTEYEALLSQLAGSIKRGKIVEEDSLPEVMQGVRLLGSNDKRLAMQLKKRFSIKRFKLVEPGKTDKEVRSEGVELIQFADDRLGWVQGRQDIQRFEAIDMKKPARGMQIGMMPAKLTQILVNIARADITTGAEQQALTLWDPFCGFGTTGFVVNNLGHHFIGSDINITPAKQNKKWWLSSAYAYPEHFFTLFKHDVHDVCSKPMLQQVDAVVTEGWLGPVVKKGIRHTQQGKVQVEKNIDQIVELYTAFLQRMASDYPRIPLVMTTPVYLFLRQQVIQDRIQDAAKEQGYTVHTLGEIYQRKKQQVGRQAYLLHHDGV